MKMRKLLAVLLCVCLLSSCPTVLATLTEGRMKLEYEMKNDGLSINGHIVNPNQTVTMGRDGQLHKSEEIGKLQEKLKQLGYFVNLVPFTGSDGKIHYQGGTNSVLDDLFSLLKNNIALFDGQKSIAVVNEPADITLTGNHGTLLVGPGARESTVTVQSGSIDNLVVVGGSVGVNIGGQVQNLYVSEDTTVNTMHRHYPGEQKKVNEIPATPTKGGQYTLITYCGDPTCGQQIDINTYQTDPLPLPPSPPSDPELETKIETAAEPARECPSPKSEDGHHLITEEPNGYLYTEEDGKHWEVWYCKYCEQEVKREEIQQTS